ncbi:hypothetical protein [Streptomyces sp. NPDC014806]|uniref:hypothetical protein n=1 Tax=Streptomyces sp. NPDC014806 TaxID=3364920 RepID=UPI0036FFA8A8
MSYFNGTNGTPAAKPVADLRERECRHSRNQRHSNSTRNGTPPELAVTRLPAHLVAERAERAAETVRTLPCPRCGADTLVARTPDRVAAVDVRADPHPVDPAAIPAGRLGWCLVQHEHTPDRIRWRDRWHAKTCTHPVLVDHVCPSRAVQETLL